MVFHEMYQHFQGVNQQNNVSGNIFCVNRTKNASNQSKTTFLEIDFHVTYQELQTVNPKLNVSGILSGIASSKRLEVTPYDIDEAIYIAQIIQTTHPTRKAQEDISDTTDREQLRSMSTQMTTDHTLDIHTDRRNR